MNLTSAFSVNCVSHPDLNKALNTEDSQGFMFVRTPDSCRWLLHQGGFDIKYFGLNVNLILIRKQKRAMLCEKERWSKD